LQRLIITEIHFIWNTIGIRPGSIAIVELIAPIIQPTSWEILEAACPAATSCLSTLITSGQAQWSGAFWRMEAVFYSLVINHSTAGDELFHYASIGHAIVGLNKNLSSGKDAIPDSESFCGGKAVASL
jgi:hypothetical protein